MNTKHGFTRALVTGASSGIGKAFAELLAQAGTDLVLVARNVERLGEIADSLRTKHGRQVEVVVADLEDRDQLSGVEQRLREDAEIDLLVNNAGYGHTGAFGEERVDKAQGQIDCNVTALTRLAHAGLQNMLRHRRGGILNVASGAAFLPTPSLAVYAATKAYVVSLSQALHEEAKCDGVTVTVLCPGLTRTEFQTRAKYDASKMPAFAWQTPEQVAQEALAALAAGKVICVPGIQNRVTLGLVSLIPRSAVAGLVGRVSSPQRSG